MPMFIHQAHMGEIIMQMKAFLFLAGEPNLKRLIGCITRENWYPKFIFNQPLAAFGDPLTALGYHHVPHPDDAFCPFFHRPAAWPHTHHIHVVEYGGIEERRTLAFRDYLRDHDDAAREYERIKIELAERLVGVDHESRESYARAKSEFIERIVARALGGVQL